MQGKYYNSDDGERIDYGNVLAVLSIELGHSVG